MAPSRSVITIVGGGFAGAVLALHLARQPGLPARADVHLIEPRAAPGPGLAYAPGPPAHLLNVRPGALSLYPDQPTHFADWLARQPEVAAEVLDFAPRFLYGSYLAEELAAAPGVRWHHTEALAAPLIPGGRRTVRLADGTVIESDYVVLALGNFPPPPPAGPDLRVEVRGRGPHHVPGAPCGVLHRPAAGLRPHRPGPPDRRPRRWPPTAAPPPACSPSGPAAGPPTLNRRPRRSCGRRPWPSPLSWRRA